MSREALGGLSDSSIDMLYDADGNLKPIRLELSPLNSLGFIPGEPISVGVRTVEEAEAAYRELLGMEVERKVDKPGTVYSPHYHDHEVRLLSIRGKAIVNIDGDWQYSEDGQEIVIPANTVHEAQILGEGWEYLAAHPADAENPFVEFDPATLSQD